MRRDTVKMLFFGGAVAFAVLFGMELSSRGIAEVNGPLTGGSTTVEQTGGDGAVGAEGNGWALPDERTRSNETSEREDARLGVRDTGTTPEDPNLSGWQRQGYDLPAEPDRPIVDKVSVKTAEVLHDLSRSGIRFVVDLFDRVTQ